MMRGRSLCVLVALWLLQFPVWAQAPLPLNPNVRQGVLPNGMHYYVLRNAKPEKRVELRLALKAGSVLETDEQQGLAHFVEHMGFNGTEHFKKSELVDYLESVGTRFGADLNAYTSFDETVYMLQVATDADSLLDKGLLVMQDWAGGASLEDEEIDKERGVVIEEWRLGQGAQNRMLMQWLPKVMAGSRYAERLPIGKKEVLENFSYQTLRDFYSDWYRPDLMAIIVVGDVDPEAMEQRIRQQFGSLTRKSRAPKREKYTIPGWQEPRVAIAKDKESPMTMVQLSYLHPEFIIRTEADYRTSLIHSLYNGMIQERLAELTKTKDAPFMYGYSAYSGFLGPVSAYISVAAVRNDGLLGGLEALVRENRRVQLHGFTATELERQKIELMSFIEKAHKERNTTESANFARELVQYYLEGEAAPGIEAEYALYQKLLAGITLEEVNAMGAGFVTKENMALVVYAPDKEGVRIPTEAELLSVIVKVEAEKITPYVDKVSNAPLLAQLPKKGKVTKTEQLANGITRLTLSNGVVVLLKPTDFKQDQVVFSATQQGGLSQIPDAQYLSASMADEVVEENGLGEFGQIALEKKLAGTQISLMPVLGELSHGMNGNCPPEQLETFFQLLYLYYTAPRVDEEAFEALIEKTHTSLENEEADPMSVYSKAIRRVLYNNHLRTQPLRLEDLPNIKQQEAINAYKQLFGNARGTTVTLVGNFDVNKVKALLEQYVATLPAAKTAPAWKDNRVQIVPGPKDETVHKGVEPKSYVTLCFSGPFEYSREQNFALQNMLKVLEIKLRENLREDKGGVYGVGAYGSGTSEPQGRYSVFIRFGCNPDRVEELTQAVREEIQALQRDGGQEKELAKVRETLRREHELDLKENRWWMRQMSAYQKYGYPFAEITAPELDKKLAAWNGAAVKAAAIQYLPLDSYLRIVLRPENP
ncbi:MAG: insulinase family protein [Bacteroidetes bacterium]|nr:insulinase family protein [Bacteroidota bacterium]